MAEKLEIDGELKDGISGPAHTIVTNLTQISEAVEGIKKAFEVLEGVGFVFILEKISEAVKKLGESFFEVSHRIWDAEFEALKFGEEVRTSFELAGESAAGASEHFNSMVKLAGQLPLSVHDVFRYAQTFRDAGIGLSEGTMTRLLQATSAVKVLNPLKENAAGGFVEAIGRVSATGMNSRSITQMWNAAHVSPAAALENFKRITGATDVNIHKLGKYAGTEYATQWVEAFLGVIEARGGQGLGAKMGMEDVGGMVDTMKKRFAGLFVGASGEEGGGTGALRGFMQKMVEVTEPGGRLMTRLKDNFTSVWDAINGALFGDEGGRDVAGAFEQLVAASDHAAEFFKIGWAGVGGFLNEIFSGLGDIFGKEMDKAHLEILMKDWAERGKDVALVVKDIAGAMWEVAKAAAALIEGTRSLFEQDWHRNARLAHANPEQPHPAGQDATDPTQSEGAAVLAGITGANSPASSFVTLGRNWMRGLQKGLSKGYQGDIGMPGGRGGGGVSIQQDFHFGGDMTEEQRTEIARAVKDATAEALASAFEQLGIEAGVVGAS